MAGGLVALFDDVAVLARAAAASLDDIGPAAGRAAAKAAGVVVDDAAVTPQYIHGLAAHRELPVIRRIAVGSLRNKLLILLPVVLLLSQFLPWLLTPLLMLGGVWLCFEGAEKVWQKLRGQHGRRGAVSDDAPLDEDTIVSGAVRTDLILSAEIMVISLNEVVDQPFTARAVILAIVAVAITVLVYGVVGAIVKMDDVGLRLAERPGKGVARVGRGLVKAMPRMLAALTLVGTAAMLWVGGHILVVGTAELGLNVLSDALHHGEEVGGAVGEGVAWLVSTLASALIGLVVGAVVVLLMSGTLNWHNARRPSGPDSRGGCSGGDQQAGGVHEQHAAGDPAEGGH